MSLLTSGPLTPLSLTPRRKPSDHCSVSAFFITWLPSMHPSTVGVYGRGGAGEGVGGPDPTTQAGEGLLSRRARRSGQAREGLFGQDRARGGQRQREDCVQAGY